jgi:ABC-2 type transport system ATP-binding protein
MIETQDLSKKFEDFSAVDGVTLDVKAGQVLALLGPNGAGKTTTVRMLSSILRPTRGRAVVAGYDVVENPTKVRACVGVLTEQHGLYGRMPVEDYLDFFGQLYELEADKRKKRIDYLLIKFGLADAQQHRIAEYSKGMRQKLALARAMLHDPKVLLLDEPTSAMDPASARLVRDSILSLRSEKRTILICTHNLVEAEMLADQIAIIRKGKIIAKGSPASLKQILVGPQEYILTLANPFNALPDLPDDVQIVSKGSNWVRYKTEKPEEVNPSILRSFLANDFSVLSLEAIHLNLEDVYLQVINSSEEGELSHVA